NVVMVCCMSSFCSEVADDFGLVVGDLSVEVSCSPWSAVLMILTSPSVVVGGTICGFVMTGRTATGFDVRRVLFFFFWAPTPSTDKPKIIVAVSINLENPRTVIGKTPLLQPKITPAS